MKPTTFISGRLLLALLAIGMITALVSWDFKRGVDKFNPGQTDTIPKVKEKKIRDLDDVMEQLNREDFEKEIRVNLEKAKKEIEEAMKQIDGDKLKLEIEKAMKGVDMEKIKQEMDKAKIEMEKAFKEVDLEKLKIDLDQSLAKVNWDQIKKEIEEVQNLNLDKLKIDMDKLQDELKEIMPGLDKEMGKLKIEMEKLKVEMQEYKDFVDGLEKDGLINKKEPYTIKHKNGELTINGKKAPEATYNKYRSFLDKHKEFKIDKSDDDFNIDIDNDND